MKTLLIVIECKYTTC